MQSPKYLLLASFITAALSGCSKEQNSTDLSQGHGGGTPKATAAKVTQPLLGLSLCKDSAIRCESSQLKLPEQSVSGDLRTGGEANALLNSALPNVVGAKSDARNLTITVNLPETSAREEIEIEIPKAASDTVDRTGGLQDTLIRAFNQSSSDDIYAFAQKSETSATNRRVKVTLAKITNETKQAAGTDELPPHPAAADAYMGQRNVRGAEQEVVIAETRVDLSYLSQHELGEIKRNQEDMKQYPELARLSVVTVYFQNGQVRSRPNTDRHSDKAVEIQDFCFVLARVPTPKARANHVNLGGVITLVTGTSSYGPVHGDGTLPPEFTQTSDLGFQASGAKSFAKPGKGYNKFGNGRRDSENLVSVGCTSKKRKMTVHTIVHALGKERVQVGYPRANIVESYLDEQNGVDLNFGFIQYRQKRLDRAAGDKLTVLKDIESSKKSDVAVSFQNGQPVGEKIDFGGGPLCSIANHLKVGTTFTLVKAWPNTVQLGDNAPVTTGAAFTTDHPAIERVSVNVVPNWLDAPSKVTANPALLDAKAISDCFGSYVSIAK